MTTASVVVNSPKRCEVTTLEVVVFFPNLESQTIYLVFNNYNSYRMILLKPQADVLFFCLFCFNFYFWRFPKFISSLSHMWIGMS